MRIAFLGLGQMGSAIAKLLVEKGYETTVWNRTAAAGRALEEKGATIADTPALAVADADTIFTMLHDDEAVESVLFEQGALDAMREEAVHVSMSTISVALAQKLEAEHATRKQRFLGCPVFGRPAVAAEGKLWLVLGGPEDLVTEMTPILSLFSRGISVVGENPSLAHAVKLGGNFLITAMIASLSESITYAESHSIAPELFLETVNSALFQSPFYSTYGQVMLHPPDQAAATITLGAKDMKLFREAAKETGTRTPLGDIFQQQLNAAVQDGKGDQDWAAGYLELVRNEAKGLEKV